MSIFGFIKPSPMSSLQQQVFENGVCARCHMRTMHFVHSGAGMDFWQCTACKTVAILPSPQGANDG